MANWFVLSTCGYCDAGNRIPLGDPDDPTRQDVSDWRCWRCRTVQSLIEPEALADEGDGFVVEGLE